MTHSYAYVTYQFIANYCNVFIIQLAQFPVKLWYATWITFSEDVHKGYRGWPCAKMQVAEQQNTDLPCVGVYEVDCYRGFMVYR